jgi:fusobacterium outer membrane protein
MPASINPRVIDSFKITRTAKTVNTPNVPETIDFNPISPTIPSINPARVDVKDITLSALWNNDRPSGSQYQFSKLAGTIGGTPKIIGNGTTYQFSVDSSYATAMISGYDPQTTFLSNHVYKTSEGARYRSISGYTLRAEEPRQYQFGAIFEFE